MRSPAALHTPTVKCKNHLFARSRKADSTAGSPIHRYGDCTLRTCSCTSPPLSCARNYDGTSPKAGRQMPSLRRLLCLVRAIERRRRFLASRLATKTLLVLGRDRTKTREARIGCPQQVITTCRISRRARAASLKSGINALPLRKDGMDYGVMHLAARSKTLGKSITGLPSMPIFRKGPLPGATPPTPGRRPYPTYDPIQPNFNATMP